MDRSRFGRSRTHTRRWRLGAVAGVAVLALGVGLGVASAGEDVPAAQPPAISAPTAQAPAAQAPADTPVAVHGQLSVCGVQLCDEAGEAIQLRGMSSHGLQFFPD
ncbi:hypothetical protein QQG74_14395 [Micromonospora sp. FIMYZ51]|uniref:hypothetical protein n=1 Tax=Micromonospora sp. FIMYZ51 TaxID=3051832 RepID=UPI00311FB035